VAGRQQLEGAAAACGGVAPGVVNVGPNLRDAAQRVGGAPAALIHTVAASPERSACGSDLTPAWPSPAAAVAT